jgi:hypothetical protein
MSWRYGVSDIEYAAVVRSLWLRTQYYSTITLFTTVELPEVILSK